MKYTKFKSYLLNILSIVLIFSFLIGGIILILLASNTIKANINKAGSISCYVFGSIFLVFFIFIISKIISIFTSENNYKKNAIDLDKMFKDFELSKEQINSEKLFENAPAFDKESRNIYYTYLQNYARKSFRRSSLKLNSIDLKHLIEKFIIEIKQTYEIFDVYLAIEYTKAINKKFILRGEYKHYKLYFDGIRKILHQLNMIVRKMLNFS